MAMTEHEWMTCQTSPAKMLKFVQNRSSDRKLRLFTCACARLLWNENWHESGLKTVETAEACADGLLAGAELEAAMVASHTTVRPGLAQEWPSWIPAQTCMPHARYAAWSVNADCNLGQPMPLRPGIRANLIRCIFRPVQFPKLVLADEWLTWHDATVSKLAEAVYEERALPIGQLDAARLAILADALEEAGCSSEEILNHLREAGPHVRGCWVVDLLLGKS